jgi:branched-chain amino acid aminotransferase
VILGEIRVPGIRVIEKTVMPADLEGADEVFITSTTRNLLPVRQVEEQPVGRADRARKALAEGFGEYVRNYIAAQKEVVA